MYNDKQSSTLAQARAKNWKAMKTKSYLGLPPDEDSLHEHLLCAYYQPKVECS